ncbi:9252_t:CDS:2 [Dentiscutata heterogama]|uniref:9252_t:CDS:1 n=1 Tax=Dentiscutata heterogama TaxID=1316150 RepID=A0ACA9KZB9_9GLOM|nr:9252_t:CDS:2 [Dentiscutata heterogama]
MYYFLPSELSSPQCATNRAEEPNNDNAIDNGELDDDEPYNNELDGDKMDNKPDSSKIDDEPNDSELEYLDKNIIDIDSYDIMNIDVYNIMDINSYEEMQAIKID